MGDIRVMPAVRPVAGLLAQAPELLQRAQDALAGWFGPIALVSETKPFVHTTYYDAEMGGGLLRRFVVYQGLLAPDGLPDWIETTNVAREGEEPAHYVVCNERRTLLYLINLGSIDLHPWFSHRGSLDSPDWAVLDLDPKEAPFPHVIKIAREAGKLLRGLGLEPFLKTSGSSGLHVFVPLAPGYTYEQSRMFCEAVARLLVRDHGDIATVERSVGRREGKVYVDFLQNRREQTVVPPYVVRPVEAASVSMPLDWDELESELRVESFTLANAPARVGRTGDLFRPALSKPQDLAPAVAALGRYL